MGYGATQLTPNSSLELKQLGGRYLSEDEIFEWFTRLHTENGKRLDFLCDAATGGPYQGGVRGQIN